MKFAILALTFSTAVTIANAAPVDQECLKEAIAASNSIMALNFEDTTIPTHLAFVALKGEKHVWQAYKYVDIEGYKQSYSNTYELVFSIRPDFAGGGCELVKYEMKGLQGLI